MLGSLSNLAFLGQQQQLADIIIPGRDDSDDEQPDTTEAEPDNTAEAPDGRSAPEPEPEPKAETTPARLKGLNVANLLHEVGANSLSGVDPSRYSELMDNLARALEGMG